MENQTLAEIHLTSKELGERIQFEVVLKGETPDLGALLIEACEKSSQFDLLFNAVGVYFGKPKRRRFRWELLALVALTAVNAYFAFFHR